MTNIKFYGGPMHGRIETIPDEVLTRNRWEVRERPLVRRRVAAFGRGYMDAPIDEPAAFDTTTYYFKLYALNRYTRAFSQVRKTTMVAVLEGADLTHREMYDMEMDMEKLPWNWEKEPSILHEFEAWWEKQLHDRGVEKISVY